jgi:iron complex outermembrane receptor protein
MLTIQRKAYVSALALSLVLPVLAQTPEPQRLKEVIVTGSNIPTADEVGAVLVKTIGQQEIQASGATDVLDILKKATPGFVGNGNLGKTNSNISGGSTLGGSQVSLRNLTTLVLVNGRRVASSPAVSQGGYEFVDVNQIPTSAIEKIEVLKDGASAIYGSDAVGGVVNIILKKNYNGVEISGRYGFSTGYSHTESKGSIVGGVSNEKTSFFAGAEITISDPIHSNQRPFSASAYKSTNYPGVLGDDSDNGYYLLNPNLNSPLDAVAPGSATIATNGASQTLSGFPDGVYASVPSSQVRQGFNLANKTYVTLQDERYQYFASANHEIYGKEMELYGDFMYTDSKNSYQLNGQPFTVYDGVVIPAGGPGSLVKNPFNVTLDGNTNFGDIYVTHRLIDSPRVFTRENDFYRFSTGIKGDVMEKYFYDVGYLYSQNKTLETTQNLPSLTAINSAIADGSFDIFARNNPQSVTQAFLGTSFGEYKSSLYAIDAKFGGSPFELPAGDFSFVVGAQYRGEELDAKGDYLSSQNPPGLAGATSINPIHSNRAVNAGYTEISIPIFSPAWNVPGANSLTVSAAGRFEHYSDSGDTGTPQVKLRWQPIDDQLTVRGSYSTSFVAPDLFSTSGPISIGFSDPLPGFGDQQAKSVSGSNPNLKPTKSENWTAGMVYTPKQVPGLTVSVDYFKVYETDTNGLLGAAYILDSVEAQGTASPYAGLVHFNSVNGPGVTGAGQVYSKNPNSVFVQDQLTNIGAQKVSGLDWSANYELPTDNYGKFTFGSELLWYLQYDAQPLRPGAYYNYAGTYTKGGAVENGTIPDFQLVGTFRYEWKSLTYDLVSTLIPSTEDIGPGGSSATAPVKVAEYAKFDMRVGYEFGKQGGGVAMKDKKDMTPASTLAVARKQSLLDGVGLGIGCENVMDTLPPYVPSETDNNTDTGTYDPRGRFVYFEASKKF